MGTSNGIGIQSMSALADYLGCSTGELKEKKRNLKRHRRRKNDCL